MLDNSTLSQLKQLKTDIRQTERRHQGEVSGSQHSFGFVRADEGQQFFLPPLEMQKTFPGDRIEFQVRKDDQNREFAAVEKLLSSELKQFCGKCVQHGKAWFVEMDVVKLKRKLFLPPPQRKNVSPGDWLRCRVSRHPIKDGKGQAAVLQNLGSEEVADFPSRYAAVNFALPPPGESAAHAENAIDTLLLQRADHRSLALASIDPPASRDIDDALFARPVDGGWELFVAIADPTSLVDAQSKLDKAAFQRAATSYLPHQQAPMLPAQLSEDSLSLLAGRDRPALLCKLDVDPSGAVTGAEFEEASVCNRAQLSYDELNDFFDREDFPAPADQATRDSLQALRQVTQQMRQWRSANQLLPEERPEFDYTLADNGRIESFKPRRKGSAQRIVEECMLATNRAAARKLADYGGLFNTHAGFRSEKLGDAERVLRAAGFDTFGEAGDLEQLQTYRAAISYLAGRTECAHARIILSRFLQRARLSAEPGPHLGMGIECYTAVTSPLRRYVDLFNHRQLKRQLLGEPPLSMDPDRIERLELQLTRLRSASHWSEQWLKCEYLERNPREQYAGRVVQANPFGLVIQLADSGIEGVLEKRCLPGKKKFNPTQLRFGEGAGSIGLDDEVVVGLKSIDRDQRRILFEWQGEPVTAKPPSEDSKTT